MPPDDWPERFLADFAKTGNVSASARKAGATRNAVYARRDVDRDFAVAMEDAREQATDLLEAEAVRRALRGTLKPIFYQGAECGKVREFSDTLLVVLLKANRPDRFRENSRVEHTGNVGVIPVREIVVERPKGDDGESSDAV